MTDAAGRAFEDMVANSVVLFAPDGAIHMPMRVELIDEAGLVVDTDDRLVDGLKDGAAPRLPPAKSRICNRRSTPISSRIKATHCGNPKAPSAVRRCEEPQERSL